MKRLSERFDDALMLAASLHRDDVRKGTSIPYIAHLLGVCELVLSDGGDEDEAIAALLHDAIEDHAEAVSASDIEQRFSARMRRIVGGCTDAPADYRGGPKPEWRLRKEAYVAHVAQTPPGDLRVSMANKPGRGYWAKKAAGQKVSNRPRHDVHLVCATDSRS